MKNAYQTVSDLMLLVHESIYLKGGWHSITIHSINSNFDSLKKQRRRFSKNLYSYLGSFDAILFPETPGEIGRAVVSDLKGYLGQVIFVLFDQ